MRVGDRVFVETKNFKGMAKILHIAINELYPLQVEMDETDSDGHKIFRVAYYEIVKETANYRSIQSVSTKETNSPESQRQMSFIDLL